MEFDLCLNRRSCVESFGILCNAAMNRGEMNWSYAILWRLRPSLRFSRILARNIRWRRFTAVFADPERPEAGRIGRDGDDGDVPRLERRPIRQGDG